MENTRQSLPACARKDFSTACITLLRCDDDDDDDEMPILPCAEKLELVLSTAPKTSDNTDEDSKNRKRSH